MGAWQDILRKRFDPLWQDPPELTVLVGTPGWGRSTWLKQCMDHQLTRPSVLIATRIGLQRLLAAPERDLREMTLFIDDVLISAADELWPELTELLAEGIGCRAVLTSMDLPPVTSSENFEIHILDERDLAFDPDEIREVVALNSPDAPPDEVAALHTHLRGCPVLVRRQLDRLNTHGSRFLWANADATLERTLITETLHQASTRFGRIMELATSFRTFSAEVLVHQLPALTREEVEADFARLQASPLGRIDYSDDNADEIFVWNEGVWQEVGRHEDPDVRRRRLELARDATRDAGCVNGELYYHLHLGDLAAAERLVFEDDPAVRAATRRLSSRCAPSPAGTLAAPPGP